MTKSAVIETVDLVVLTARSGHLEALLIRRGKAPHAGELALAGGRVDRSRDKTLNDAAVRELREETGLNVTATTLDLIGCYDEPGRDPRGHTISTAFLSVLAEPVALHPGDDASGAFWIPVHDALIEALAFDHEQILRDGLELSERLGHTAALHRQYQ